MCLRGRSSLSTDFACNPSEIPQSEHAVIPFNVRLHRVDWRLSFFLITGGIVRWRSMLIWWDLGDHEWNVLYDVWIACTAQVASPLICQCQVISQKCPSLWNKATGTNGLVILTNNHLLNSCSQCLLDAFTTLSVWDCYVSDSGAATRCKNINVNFSLNSIPETTCQSNSVGGTVRGSMDLQCSAVSYNHTAAAGYVFVRK